MAREEGKKPVSEAVAEATEVGVEGVRAKRPRGRGGRASDVLGAEIRRRDVFPLLVLHLVSREQASYGNRLIERIEEITEGTISANPNTIYPLLRDLESRGLIEGHWEHPDRRSRRHYTVTAAGKREYRRLREEVEPFLDSVVRSIGLLRSEIYG
ncbi:MAG: PadR family transcriptional regulator [Solirubrobacterales bacterium]